MRLGKPIFRIDIESILIVEYDLERPHCFTFFYPLLDLQGRSKFSDLPRQIILSFSRREEGGVAWDSSRY
jgi:hypothetical protein